MQADWNKIDKAVAKARAFYETARPVLEATAMHKFVCVNANSGEYVLGDSIREAHQSFDEKFGVGVPSWITQVGNPNHVGSGLGLLQ